MNRLFSILLLAAMPLAVLLPTAMPASAHTSTGNACITTTIDGTPLATPICDFPPLVTGNSTPACAVVIPATFSGGCMVGNEYRFYINGVRQVVTS